MNQTILYVKFSDNLVFQKENNCDLNLSNLQPVIFFSNITSCPVQNMCSGEPTCFNSANCSTFSNNNIKDYVCTCPSGFKGKLCQYEKQSWARISQEKHTCPAKWWGMTESGVCGPCNCDELKNFSPDCDKNSGKC